MVDVVKEAFNIAFNEPFNTWIAVLDVFECRMTTSIRSKAMR